MNNKAPRLPARRASKKPSQLWRSRAWVNVYRWGRCGRSKRPNHGRRHIGQRWTWGVSAAIEVVIWALRRFRQMDTVLSSLMLQESLGWGTLRAPRVHRIACHLSEPVQTHCTAGDPSRQHPCLSVSIVSDPLLGEQVINR